jgi:hypothetical protein
MRPVKHRLSAARATYPKACNSRSGGRISQADSMSASLDNLTLREKLRNVEKLTRELSDHLEKGFLPKVHGLRRLARKGTDPEFRETISDIAIRESVSTVLKSDAYARELSENTRRYLRSIQADIDGMFDA